MARRSNDRHPYNISADNFDSLLGVFTNGGSKTQNPNTTNLSDANNGQLEYVGDLKFEAQDYDLKSIPTNKEAAKAAAEMMPWMRTAALMLSVGDDELSALVEGGPEEFMEMCEGIASAHTAKKSEADLLQAGYCRLIVALERGVGKDEINRFYGARAQS